MHDDVLLINFTTKPHIQNANVSQRIEIEKNTKMEGERSVQIVHGNEAWVVKLIRKMSSCIRPIMMTALEATFLVIEIKTKQN